MKPTFHLMNKNYVRHSTKWTPTKSSCFQTRKASLRVDLTPMVDLGFLLISFFVLTTTIAKPTSMKLAVPDDNKKLPPSEAAESKTLNILLGADNNTFVYGGSALNNIKNTGSSASALRIAIIQKKKSIRDQCGNDSGMIVLIKPTAAATYANIVNTFDEMLICNIKTYVLMDANNDELKSIGL
jgi:biopolymer transport protein ExbD